MRHPPGPSAGQSTRQPQGDASEDVTLPRLGDAIASYAAALEQIPAQTTDDAPLKVMQVLLARNAIAKALSVRPLDDPIILKQLMETDQNLKARAETITIIVGREKLANWRETIQPAADDWWWSIDELPAPKPNPLWAALSVFLLLLAAALTAEIARRFLSSGGPDFAAISIPLLQAVLTFISGSTLTQTGQEWIERFLLKRNTARKHHPMLKTAVPLIVVLVIAGFYLSLPSFGRYYARRYLHQQAVDLQAAGKLDEAIKNYDRALLLDPDFVPAHYNLGDAYETSGNYDKAITEYQAALQLDANFYFAQNNLARLLLLRRGDPSTALKLLNAALELDPQASHVKYSIYKNRAWAHLNLKCYDLAAADLCEALGLREDGAAAYCLLAQVLEAEGPSETRKSCSAYKDDVAEAWAQCLANKAGQERELEASWLSLAQERMGKELAK